MSLSQKHVGKVLVPWFNITEWQTVHFLIYTENAQNWSKALKMLKIWKLRTPLLSAGVEGTLILLEALLTDTHKLSSYELTHIMSTSLMRFLNLCAAYSDKQGTFYKAAMKSGLPKWLVGMRHDIAHSHHVPSQSMLDLSLRFCLAWLKEKYWDVQYECMSDLVVSKLDDSLLESCMYVHIQLATLGVLENNNKELRAHMSRIIDIHDENEFTNRQLLEHVNNTLKTMLQSNAQEAVDKIGTLLIDNHIILQTDIESNDDGTKKLPSCFLKRWNSLLEVIYEAEAMPNFIYRLFSFLCDDSHNLLHREIASLWIQEIFKTLLNQHQNMEVLQFNGSNKFMMDNKFKKEVLDRPTPFTSNFLKLVLEYNNAPIELIEDCVNLVSALYTDKNYDSGNANILTVEDLNLKVPGNSLVNDLDHKTNFRWVLVEDAAPYKNLPLGVLPQQSRSQNPLLDL